MAPEENGTSSQGGQELANRGGVAGDRVTTLTARGAVSRKIQSHDPGHGREPCELRAPRRVIAARAVHQHERGSVGAALLVVQAFAVDCQARHAWATVRA